MKEKIKSCLRPWADVFTWHTSHPLDQNRFYESVESLYNLVGDDNLTVGDLFEAISEIRTDAPESLDGKIPDSKITEFAQRAYGIIGYLGYKDR